MAMHPGPYSQFNFRVDLGGGSVEAGFQEASGIGTSTTEAEHRADDAGKHVTRKITGLNKAGEVTFKRGVAGVRALSLWLDQIRDGARGARRTVTISLQSEGQAGSAQTWTLINARILKHTSGPFHAKGTDVVIEELVLAYEGLEVD